MKEASDLSMFVSHGEAGTAHMTLAVEGVGCAGCIRKIEGGLKQLPGIVDARLNFTNRRLAVDWREDELDAAAVIEAVQRIGYRAHPFEPERAETDEAQQARWLMKCLAVAGFAAMNVMLLSVSVWSGIGHDAADARLLSLALRPHCAAGGRLCGPAVLSKRAAGDPGASSQHGRADLAGRDPGARHVGGRDRGCMRSTPISIPP